MFRVPRETHSRLKQSSVTDVSVVLDVHQHDVSLCAFHSTKTSSLNFRNFPMSNGTVLSTRPNWSCSICSCLNSFPTKNYYSITWKNVQGSWWSGSRPRSHLGQNLDKFVLISKTSVKFLSSVDQAKCDLLVPTRTKICPRRQIFKGAVVLPRSTTFCEQQICFSCDKPASQFSENLTFFRFTFWLVRRGRRIFNSTESVFLKL